MTRKRPTMVTDQLDPKKFTIQTAENELGVLGLLCFINNIDYAFYIGKDGKTWGDSEVFNRKDFSRLIAYRLAWNSNLEKEVLGLLEELKPEIEAFKEKHGIE